MATLDYHETTVDRWIDEHFPEEINGLVDLLSDAPVFAAHLTLVRHGGVALSTLWSAQTDELEKRGFAGGNFEVKTTTRDLDVLVTAAAAGKLAVRIDRQISLADVPAALAANRAGGARGKTVFMM